MNSVEHLRPPEASLAYPWSPLSWQWHLTGADIDPESDPASLEHFGISIVEGMSAGCIPIALAVGGPASIIQVRVGARGRGGGRHSLVRKVGGGGEEGGEKGGLSLCMYSQCSLRLSECSQRPPQDENI